MKPTRSLAVASLASPAAPPAQAQTEIQWWHSMSGALGEWVNDLAKDFNASQKDYKIVPTFKGSYDESMTAAIAAFRAGNAPHILQVFEVGTATMMASKGAIVPVGKVMNDAGYKFDPKRLRAGRGRLLHGAQRPDAELPVQQLDHRSSTTTRTPSRPPAWTPRSRRRPGPKWRWPRPSSRPAATSARSPPAGSSWTQLESFSAWHNVLFATKNNGFGGLDARLAFNTPLHVRHIENLANMAKQGLFVYKGRGNARRRHLRLGRMRHDHRLLGAATATSSATPSSPTASAPCPTTPTCRARRRTP